MNDRPIQIDTGQTVRLEQGVVKVIQSAVLFHHYRMSVQHFDGAQLEARGGDYGALLEMLGQLEVLGYELRALNRVEGRQ